MWLSVHVFCGCSKLLESLRKELSLSAGKWHSLQAGFTQCLLSTHPHQVQVPVTHLRAKRFWIYLEIQVSELLSRLQRAAKAATSSAQLSTMQGPGIYPTPFVLPSSWSDPHSQISRQNYPFRTQESSEVPLGSKWNPVSMSLSFRLTEHARGQPWPAGDIWLTVVRWHYFPFFFPRDPTNTFSPPSGIVILAGTSQRSSFDP